MTNELAPSEVRERILAQHRDIQTMLDQLEEGAEQLRGGATPETEWLKKAARALGQVLEWHMALEEKYLVPMVRQADGFGPERAEQLEKDHRAQSKELAALLRGVSKADGDALADKVLRLAEMIRLDIDHEEKSYVNERVLRDDLVRVDAFGG